jgi:hypothetical protein
MLPLKAVALALTHQGHLITTISNEDMTMTTNNDTKSFTAIGSRLCQLLEAYSALAELIPLDNHERPLFEILNSQFRTTLDEADELGLMP